MLYIMAASALQPFEHVSGVECALSDKLGMLTMTIPDRDSSCGTLEPAKTKRTGKQVAVTCKKGDDLLATGQAAPPDIVKIDVEGHEAAVLRGMQQTIRRHQPVIFFEHISLQDEEIHRMVPDNYSLSSVSDADGTIGTSFDRSIGHNSVMIPRCRRHL
jgi:FkbM family methyltransferase